MTGVMFSKSAYFFKFNRQRAIHDTYIRMHYWGISFLYIAVYFVRVDLSLDTALESQIRYLCRTWGESAARHSSMELSSLLADRIMKSIYRFKSPQDPGRPGL